MAFQPERTCVGCRAPGPASSMVRLIAPDGRVRALTGRARDELMPGAKRGRGAWVHLGCLGQALARGALERAFRRQVEIGEQLALLARAHGAPGRPITSGNSR
ncbi:MAG: YlxR family protein [Polyangia bacterium]|jgi:predicted RNA-binding protein YlxR (DUF448 family)